MNLRYLFLISILVTACVFPSLALADESKEFKKYKALCDRGDAKACAVLGAMYYEGTGVTKDDAQAVALFRKACDGGSAPGCFNLGVMYEDGNGVTKDVAQAVAFYRKACDGRSPMGCSPSLMSAKRR